MRKLLFKNPEELREVMYEYINSCKVARTIKMRDLESGDFLETIKDLNNSTSFIWVKAPSVYGLANYCGFYPKTFYLYKKRPGYKEVCEEFEAICDEADMDCLYSSSSANGAKWRLQLRGFETDKEKEDRLALEEARKQKREKHSADMQSINLKNKLLEVQLEKVKQTGEVDPLISQLIKEIGINE